VRRTAWIWFMGFAVWVGDGLVQIHYHATARAELAFMVALVFLAAGFFYRAQQKR
jgi:hypothetical protein